MSRPFLPQKRSHLGTQPPSSTSYNASDVIEISSDDEPERRSPKRHKSTPPVTNGSINGVLHRHAHAGASTGASDQHIPETPFVRQPTGSRETLLPALQSRENLNSVTTSKTTFKKPDAVSHKTRTPIPEQINSHNATAPGHRETKRLAPAGLNNQINGSRSFVLSMMGQKVSNGVTSQQKGASRLSRNPAEVVESEDDKNPDHVSDANALEILQHFRPTNMPKTSHPSAESNVVEFNVSQPRESTIKVELQSQQRIAASFPIRPSPSPAKPQRPSTPPRQTNLQVVVPQSESKENFMAKRAQLMVELKKDTRIAREKRDIIERYFGQNGFSQAFSVDDLARMIQAAPLFKRAPKDRSKVKLNWGTYSPPSPKYDEKGRRLRYNPIHPEDRVRELLNRRFDAHKIHPALTFRNDIDDRHINGRFQFVDEYLIRENIKRASPNTNSGCACQGACNPTTCGCLVKKITININGQKIVNTQVVKTYRQHLSDPNVVVLDDDYMTNELNPSNQHFEITECNELCGCGPSCWNRVVGRGRTVPLEIYMTERCGFGVRSSYDIHKGQFIDLYLGEVITTSEVVARESIKHPNAPSYIYSLDWFNSTNCLHVDGEEVGSAMRFINHSCSPNARNFTVQTHHGDNRIYHLAFFAIRDIPAGEQITIDYCPQEAIDVPALLNPPPQVAPRKAFDDEDPEMYRAPDDSTSNHSSEQHGSGNSNQHPAFPAACNNNFSLYHGQQPNPIRVVEDNYREQGNNEGDDDDEEEADEEELEEGRTRCYCGAPNCRKYLWRPSGRQRRKQKLTSRSEF